MFSSTLVNTNIKYQLIGAHYVLEFQENVFSQTPRGLLEPCQISMMKLLTV